MASVLAGSPQIGLYSTIPWPSAGVKAAGHLQCLGTQVWVGTAQEGWWEFRV